MNWFRKLFARKVARVEQVGSPALPSFSPPPEPPPRAAEGVEALDLRIDPDTLTTADWMRILETQEKRIEKLRNENIRLRLQLEHQNRELNVFKRALELVGVNAQAAWGMWRPK